MQQQTKNCKFMRNAKRIAKQWSNKLSFSRLWHKNHNLIRTPHNIPPILRHESLFAVPGDSENSNANFVFSTFAVSISLKPLIASQNIPFIPAEIIFLTIFSRPSCNIKQFKICRRFYWLKLLSVSIVASAFIFWNDEWNLKWVSLDYTPGSSS
jgi:hypothetical protein